MAYAGSAEPVFVGNNMRWTARKAFYMFKPVADCKPVVFSPRGACENNPKHDRTWSLVSNGNVFAVAVWLSRGYQSDPALTIFRSRKAAENSMRKDARRYEADSRWIRRS